jgi:hypothetical protein
MADTSMALAVIPSNGVDTYRMSTDAAGLCGEIVKATAQKIGGRRYVKVEGWQAIAIAHGCAASARGVEVVEGGIRAIGEVRRMDTGAVIAEAEGFVGDDEKTWASRPMYARRAMAQTRAVSRACRSAFAHVVVMIDASLSTTPAEEMGWDNGHSDAPHIPGSHSPSVDPGDAHLIRKDAIGQNGEALSQYQVDKRKAAVAAGWATTNTTPKGQISQVFDYLDMAGSPDDVSKILNVNVAVIEASGRADEVNAAADRLLQWFEKQAAGGKAAA